MKYTQKCQYLKDFEFMLGFVSNYFFYYFIYVDASFSEYMLIFLSLEGIKEGTKLPHVIKKPAYPAFSIFSYLY